MQSTPGTAASVKQSTNTCRTSGDRGRWGIKFTDDAEQQGATCGQGNYKCNGLETGGNGSHWYNED